MIRIFLTNLGKYNEGFLVGEWVDLPCNDFDSVFERIGVSDEPDENGNYYEEHFISDYETDVDGLKIDEYEDLDELNDLADTVESFDKYELKALSAFLENGCDFENAVDHVRDGDYAVYTDCYNMSDVAYEFCNGCGILDSIPESLRNYFDYEAYGRDMDIEGTFIYTGDGVYVELLY